MRGAGKKERGALKTVRLAWGSGPVDRKKPENVRTKGSRKARKEQNPAGGRYSLLFFGEQSVRASIMIPAGGWL